ncbi:MAG TPA: DUF1501 domain-containing protein [Planctomycetaceae bacterium]|nr:DUF1501 domain-containing protein [Planctomycetaceae bacterium]
MASSRRAFLKSLFGSATLVSLGPDVPGLWQRVARAAGATDHRRDTVVVALQLSGGNDGLNTLVPYADEHYGRSRRTLRLRDKEVHKIGSDLGFHPQMPEFARLVKEGRLTVVQGVGYPNSNRDHDGAMRDWHTARPGDTQCQTGWLGRAADRFQAVGDPRVRGAFVGDIAQPFALHTRGAVVPSLVALEPWQLEQPEWQPRREEAERRHQETAAPPNPLWEHARRAVAIAHADMRRVEAVLAAGPSVTDYPPFALAAHLKTVAQLVRADIGIRVFLTELGGGGIGGFDNHAAQRDNHAALLRQLSQSVAAFVDDLAADGTLDRVVLMTFSEFGRTLAENGRRGTDHGDAAPMFLAGSRLCGGLVGPHPDLGDLDRGAPRFHTDFRRVYATLLDSWLGLDSTAILSHRYEALDLLRT